jgi:hypothetical protein
MPTGAPVISAATLVSAVLINELVGRSLFLSSGAARHRDKICQRGRGNLSRWCSPQAGMAWLRSVKQDKVETAFHRSEGLTTITANPPPPTIPPATPEMSVQLKLERPVRVHL